MQQSVSSVLHTIKCTSHKKYFWRNWRLNRTRIEIRGIDTNFHEFGLQYFNIYTRGRPIVDFTDILV